VPGLIPWGASKDQLIAAIPPNSIARNEPANSVDTHLSPQLQQDLQKLQQQVQQENDGYHATHPTKYVFCSNQPKSGTDDDSWIDFAVNTTNGDGCFVSAEAMPPPYTFGVLFFHKDRFYQIVVNLPHDHFEKAERSLRQALGKPQTHRIATVQNNFGASFDNEIERWKASSVSVTIQSRSARLDEGTLIMEYEPLAASVSLPRAPAAPF